MVKFIVFCAKLFIVALVSLLFASCNKFENRLVGNEIIKTEVRTLEQPFTKISVSRGLNVEVKQGEKVEVSVEADNNLLSHIITKVVGQTLEISTDENIYSAKKKIVYVTMPTIEGLETSSGSNLSTQSTIKGNSLFISASSGSLINVSAEFDSILSDASSGSTISLAGKALKLSTDSSSGSSLNANNLIANDVKSQASSGSSTSVQAQVSLTATASSGSSINYSGIAKNVVKNTSSGGSVSSK
jgi:hypothetical protein